MPQFIVASADLDPANARATLRGAEARHCTAALRVGPGKTVLVTDGHGSRWEGNCADAGSDRVEVTNLRPVEANEPAMGLELLHGLPKGERWDHVLEKGTELGVAVFRPLYTERSVPQIPVARLEKRLRRWREKVRAAVKQCERGRAPEVQVPCSVTECLEELGPASTAERRLVLAERHTADPWPDGTGVETVRLAIGPEGGWTEDELRALTGAGFDPISLGPRILRTDTAALAGAVLVMARWGDLVSPGGRW